MGRSASDVRSGKASSNPFRRADSRPQFGQRHVPLPSGSEAASFDRWALSEGGIPSPLLMENAGRAGAQLLDRLFPRGEVGVVAGRGNNGGDAVVLARTLRAWGRPVRLYALDRGRNDPLLHGHSLDGEFFGGDEPEASIRAHLATAEILVDGLLGTGLRGAPRAAQGAWIRAMNAHRAPVFSLDVPSGVHSDTGECPGEVVQAEATVAFGAPKLGTLLHPGRHHSGRILAVEIGFPPWPEGAARARLITPAWVHAVRPRRPPVTHKNAEGRLLLWAGRPGMIGAALLAGRAALRAGVGYLRIASQESQRSLVQAAVPEALFVDAFREDDLIEAARSSDALAIGPGMGTDAVVAQALNRLLERWEGRSVLLDADALTLLGAGQLPGFARGTLPENRLLTPHLGELRRLLPTSVEESGTPLDQALAAARAWESVCLLKGTPSVLAGPNGEPLRVSSTSHSDLARAGMGDVLTGVAGAFLARGLSGLDAGMVALHLTGRSAALSPMVGESLLPGDVVEGLAAALREDGEGRRRVGVPFVTLDLA